ncbi:hypothetical protein [Spirosoma aerolatum]|uniref:hypothetical protein n=1 Tax=Spirosoma aerolatum TaxID=1211326 RepID=UPI0012D2AB3C|nr:hypothetical protein [Spirosoma aerolatum]
MVELEFFVMAMLAEINISKHTFFTYDVTLVKKTKQSVVYVDADFENLSYSSYAFKKQFGYSPNSLQESSVVGCIFFLRGGVIT